MPSLRRLNRRLTRWRRYDDKAIYAHAPWYQQGQSPGYWRVWTDIQLERQRRGLPNELDDADDFHRPGYEEDGSIYPALMAAECGWLE